MVPTRHSSSIFRPYPAEPYINRKLSVWAFQRCIVRLQQSSFGPDLPGLLLTVNILGQEGDQSPRVINHRETPVPVVEYLRLNRIIVNSEFLTAGFALNVFFLTLGSP